MSFVLGFDAGFMIEKYEYMVGAILLSENSTSKEQEWLNKHGSQGWKLIAVNKRQSWENPGFKIGHEYVFYYFKRLIQS